MNNVYKLHQIDFSKIVLSEPVDSVVNITYNDKPLYIQTPYMEVANVNMNNMYISMLGTTDTNTDLIDVFFSSFDNYMICTGKDNSSIWFRDTDRRNIKYETVRKYTDGNCVLVVDLSVPTFNTNKKLIKNGVTEGMFVKILYIFSCIHLTDSMYSVQLEPVQIKIKPQLSTEHCFQF